MATVAETRRNSRGRRRWIIGGIIALVVVGLCGGLGVFAQNASRQAAVQAAAANWETAEVSSGPIDASVNATGNIEPNETADLQFSNAGTVVKILVHEGDKVTEGQPLAQVDSVDLQLGVERAQADLKQAQADYNKLVAGATAEEITQAKAQVTQARGQYTQTSGSVTKDDITAARAKLEQAKAQLAQLQAGPKSDVQRSSQSAVDQAQANLANQRDSLSQAKTNAEIALQQAVNSLTQAQNSYATAKKNWEYVQETGRDPTNPSLVGANGKKIPNKVNDTQRQQYYDQYVQAETALKNAEASVQQAQVQVDTARQNEVVGVQNAEQQLNKVQADLVEVNAGAKDDELAAARSAVASAQAELARLTGTNRAGSLESARAGVESAEAALQKLMADPSPNDLAVAEAGVTRAEASLKQAERSLDLATLRAPFAGTITTININVGEPSTANASATSGSTGAIAIADLSGFYIDLPIDELDIAQVSAGQEARVSLDSSPDADVTGKVQKIAPVAVKNAQGTTTYSVRVSLNPSEALLMPGMTATVDIITNKKNDAVLVPRRAIQTENGKNFVWVPTSGQPDPTTGRPASERRDVALGMSNADSVEITSGLKPGETVLVPTTVQTLNPMGG